jgi:hypothetical protein
MKPYETAPLKKLMALIDKPAMKAVWVYNKVLSITNGHILIRRACTEPDGYYRINAYDQLEVVNHIPEYPNILALEKLYLTNPIVRCRLTREIRGAMLQVAHQPESFVLRPDGFGNTSFPTGLPGDFSVNSKHMTIALMEVARYDEIGLIKDEDPRRPVILGLGWNSCAMVMPLSGATPSEE